MVDNYMCEVKVIMNNHIESVGNIMNQLLVAQ